MKTFILIHPRMRGVTLIELMVVITILAIIAAVGVPTYRQYLLRSQRSEAKIALMQLQTAEEKFYLQNNAYTNNITGASPAGLGLLAVSETNKYDIAITTFPAGGQSYTATASPRAGGGQSDDKKCMSFTITDRGVRGNTGGTATPQECWK